MSALPRPHRGASVRLQLVERVPALARIARLTVAAVVSYVLARSLTSDPRPVTAALTALLVVQVTLVGTLADTVRRIVSVVAGVGLAVVVASFVHVTWWSLALVVAGSLVLGQLLRLGPHLLEVPISAMLILAVGGLGVQALDRVEETLLGAAVGVLLILVVPPAVQTRTAGAAVASFAERMGRLLDRVAAVLDAGEPTVADVRDWLGEARAVTGRLAGVDRTLEQARASRRLNPRAVGTPDTTPDLRSGLDALEHSAVALRAVFRSLADRAGADTDDADGGGPVRLGAAPTRPPGDGEAPVSDPVGDDELRLVLATVMADLARAVRGFGALVRAEVDDAQRAHPDEVGEALEAVGEARARLAELLLVDAQEAPAAWPAHGALLAGVQRVLAELDVEHRHRERERRHQQLAADRRRAVQASLAAERVRTAVSSRLAARAR